MTNTTTGGKWFSTESQLHINALELLAALYAVRSFKETFINKNIRLMLKNSAAVCTINKHGTTHSSSCNNIAVQIWYFCQEHNILLTAFHIPGVQNVHADRESRVFTNPDAEWMLNSKCLKQALIILNFMPEIDLLPPGLIHNLLNIALCGLIHMHLALMHFRFHGLILSSIVFPLSVAYFRYCKRFGAIQQWKLL